MSCLCLATAMATMAAPGSARA
uniref:MHC class I antigen n=1 Tax=Macrostomum lignano TaxID=282301 RepID=A0A1I8JQK4_9PLAT